VGARSLATSLVAPRPAPSSTLVAILNYQTASKATIDLLCVSGRVDRHALGTLWDGAKSPPVVLGQAWVLGYACYLPKIVRG
jgi:hypothetical protein